MTKSYTVEGVVISRRDYAEADRIVTLFTKEKGKLTLLAKGVRKLSSKRLGSLEIGTLIRAMAITGKSMDILSQTVILETYQRLRLDLPSITRLYQLLEVVDKLTADGQDHPEVYHTVIVTLDKLNSPAGSRKTTLLQAFQDITAHLGFATNQAVTELTLKARIETIADKKLRAKEFLMPGKINS